VDPANPVDYVSQVLEETTGEVSIRYLYGLDLLAQQQGGTTTHLGYDALSVRLHLNGSGTVAAQYRYGPFGETFGEEPTGYGYSGERWDSYTNLLYLRARYYAPGIGKFVRRDSLAGVTVIPQSLNRFTYSRNRPLRYVDPSGYDPIRTEQEARQADQIADELNWIFGVQIERDWDSHQCYNPRVLPSLQGRWAVDELLLVREVLGTFATGFGSFSAARTAVKGARIVRKETCPYFCWVTAPNFSIVCEAPGLCTCPTVCYGDGVLNQQNRQLPMRRDWGPRIAIMHELAHYWGSCKSNMEHRLREAVQGEIMPDAGTRLHWSILPRGSLLVLRTWRLDMWPV
jgi:RHS repeat-associated protein